MVDTTTPILAFVKQTIGGNRNTWGNILNTNFDLVEEAIVGRHDVSTTGGSTTLSQAQARNRFIYITGTLLSDATIVVPNVNKSWIILNDTVAGGFTVLVKTSAGTAISVPPLTNKEIMCIGLVVVTRLDRDDVGQMAFFGNSSVPPGWLECDGSAISRAGIGIDLFGKIGTTWGPGNGATTFNLPDGKTAGRFLRSRTASVALGTAQTDQNKAHTHGLTAASAASNGAHTHGGTTGIESALHAHSGTTQTEDHGLSPHYNTANEKTRAVASGAGTSAWAGADVDATGPNITAHVHGFTTGNQSVNHTHDFATSSNGAHTHMLSGSTDSDGGTEARPTNLSAILCIKY